MTEGTIMERADMQDDVGGLVLAVVSGLVLVLTASGIYGTALIGMHLMDVGMEGVDPMLLARLLMGLGIGGLGGFLVSSYENPMSLEGERLKGFLRGRFVIFLVAWAIAMPVIGFTISSEHGNKYDPVVLAFAFEGLSMTAVVFLAAVLKTAPHVLDKACPTKA